MKRITKRQVANSYRKAAKFFEDNPDSRITGMFRNPSRDKFCAIGAQCHFLKEEVDPSYQGFSAFVAHVNPQVPFEVSGVLISDQHDLIALNDQAWSRTSDVVKALRKMASAVDHGASVSLPGYPSSLWCP